MIKKLRRKIDQSLERFMDRIKKDYKLHLVNPILYHSIREYCLREGKRIRPLLLILSYLGYCPSNKKVTPSLYNASTCIELLHNFMLIHDDIIDRSNLRRGRPTMHKMLANIVKTKEPDKLGSDLAIIAGDIVYALAIDAFLSIDENPIRKERALKYFVQTAAFTAMGEFIDTIHGVDKLTKVHERDVFLNYTLKTARYTFDCPLVTGAILAGAPQEDIDRLSRLGILVGQAFQIQDDIIGIFDSEKNIGKSILSDLAESKKTILVVHAFSVLKGPGRRAFLELFNKPKKAFHDLVAIRKIFIQSGSLQYSLKLINNRLQKTLDLLKSLKINDRYRLTIEEATLSLFKHSLRIAHENDLHIEFSSR